MDRREALGMLAGIALSSPSGVGAAETGMIYRTLGKTGAKVSAIGLGGHHIGRPKDPALGIKIIRTALDGGMNFLDNCWDYNGGDSEVRMGEALLDGYREKAFLMTKFDGRTKQAAAQQIDESLKRLRTDHIDLMQFHENIRLEDPDRFFAPNGALAACQEAQKAGKIRFIGFTGHKDPIVHLRMLELAAANNFHFDACQMPLNPMDPHFRSFEKAVVPKLVEQGVAVLGMKSMGDGQVLKSGVVTAHECLTYALSLPTSVVITGCESMERLSQAFEVARTFTPMDAQQKTALLAKTQEAALTGRFEPFKTSSMFDGTAHNPQWLG